MLGMMSLKRFWQWWCPKWFLLRIFSHEIWSLAFCYISNSCSISSRDVNSSVWPWHEICCLENYTFSSFSIFNTTIRPTKPFWLFYSKALARLKELQTEHRVHAVCSGFLLRCCCCWINKEKSFSVRKIGKGGGRKKYLGSARIGYWSKFPGEDVDVNLYYIFYSKYRRQMQPVLFNFYETAL